MRTTPQQGAQRPAKTRVGHIKVDTPDVYIGRRDGRRTIRNSPPGESWGNPYRLDKYSRGTSIRKFTALLDRLCEEHPVYRLHLCDLNGKLLGCHCRAAGESEPACHGDVLAARADALALELRGSRGTCSPGDHLFVEYRTWTVCAECGLSSQTYTDAGGYRITDDELGPSAAEAQGVEQ